MPEYNSTIVKPPRSPTAPELWIPYVLIGLSCVAFLAVHFWCYHKRNRERYLRKRDEKRVKSGLIERRRITTLMVARYQSQLGIGRSEAAVELVNQSRYYSSEAGFDVNKTDNPHKLLLEGINLKSSPLPNGGPQTTFAKAEPAQKSLSNSHTWPLVSSRRSIASNAHVNHLHGRDPPNATQVDVTTGNHHKIATKAKPENNQSPVWQDSPRTGSPSHRPPKSGYPSANSPGYYQHRHYPSYMVKPPPYSHPNVFYTSLNSQFTSPSPLFFKLKQKKRRYDGMPVDDMNDCYKVPDHHHVIHDRGEVSSPFYDDNDDFSQPFIMADPNDDGFGYGSRGHNHYCHTILDASGFAVSEDEAYPFNDENRYDGLSNGFVGKNLERKHQYLDGEIYPSFIDQRHDHLPNKVPLKDNQGVHNFSHPATGNQFLSPDSCKPERLRSKLDLHSSYNSCQHSHEYRAVLAEESCNSLGVKLANFTPGKSPPTVETIKGSVNNAIKSRSPSLKRGLGSINRINVIDTSSDPVTNFRQKDVCTNAAADVQKSFLGSQLQTDCCARCSSWLSSVPPSEVVPCHELRDQVKCHATSNSVGSPSKKFERALTCSPTTKAPCVSPCGATIPSKSRSPSPPVSVINRTLDHNARCGLSPKALRGDGSHGSILVGDSPKSPRYVPSPYHIRGGDSPKSPRGVPLSNSLRGLESPISPLSGDSLPSPLQTPTLRGLDPTLVFQHSKRKLAVKSD